MSDLRLILWGMSLLAALTTLAVVGFHMSFVTVNYVLLVGVCLFHGFYGLHTMLTEYFTGPRAGIVAGTGCLATGLVLFGLTVATTLSQ
jgi:succinate dehydrogenase hydrophobic anchor subunit